MNMSKSPTHLFVPANFVPESCLPPSLHNHADSARYLLHRIIWGEITGNAMSDGFVPIKFDYLRSVIPGRILKPLKDALMKAGVIECDRYYVEGYKALGYRLGSSYREAPTKRVRIDNMQTAERVRANRRAEYKKVRLDVHKHLRCWLYRLEIDADAALEQLRLLPQFDLIKIPVEQIAAKEFFFSVCRYGRVHSTLTVLSSKARFALRCAGDGLVSMDLANSQPLFLALVLINYRQHGNRLLSLVTFSSRSNPYHDVDVIIARTISSFSEEDSLPVTPASITTPHEGEKVTQGTSLKALEEKEDQASVEHGYERHLKDDELAYVRLCEQADLYAHLGKSLPMTTRSFAKTEFFKFLYGKNRYQSPIKQAFRDEFPNVASVVQVLKKKDYRFLPCLLQKVESHVVVNTICRRLMVEHPDVPVWTIHDSLLTTPPYRAVVEDMMREEFGRLGLSPTLHFKEPP